MAKAIKTRGKARRSLADDHLPFTKQNFIILGAGLLTIALGYVAMLEGSVEGFLPLVAAPILLAHRLLRADPAWDPVSPVDVLASRSAVAAEYTAAARLIRRSGESSS